jgi:hypothetical protein
MRFLLPLLAVAFLVVVALGFAAYRRSLIPPDLVHLPRQERKAIMADRAQRLRRAEERQEITALEADSDRDFQRRLTNGL